MPYVQRILEVVFVPSLDARSLAPVMMMFSENTRCQTLGSDVQDGRRFQDANHLAAVHDRDDRVRGAGLLVVLGASGRRHVASQPLARNLELRRRAKRDEARPLDRQPRHRRQLARQLGRVHAADAAGRHDGVGTHAQPARLARVRGAKDVAAHKRLLVGAAMVEHRDVLKGRHDVLDGGRTFVALANGAARVVAAKDTGHAARAGVQLLRAGEGQRVTHGERHGGACCWRGDAETDCLRLVDGRGEEDRLALCRAFPLLHNLGLDGPSGEDDERQAEI